MSQIVIAPNALGSAQFTIASPGTSINRTLTLPDATTTIVGTDTTQTLTNKTLTTPFLSSAALNDAQAGEFEYDGTSAYFTPIGTQRGLLPAVQYYRLNTAFVGSNATGAQSMFGAGVTLQGGTVYEFSSEFALSKSAGTTSHTLSLLYGGTATLNNIMFRFSGFGALSAVTTSLSSSSHMGYFAAAAGGVSSVAITTAAAGLWYTVRGTVSVNVGGTFIPQYSLSAAPGGAYSTVIGSYFAIWPVGAAGSNTSVGTWA